jgi:hypothetical protein
MARESEFLYWTSDLEYRFFSTPAPPDDRPPVSAAAMLL